ncbi:TPA: DUF4011 domain-containing protein [Klebsiella quasipneumoniae subsp. quasipneumoniae]|nr:DUF4011 domain-containing protein [Klebsiella quasipneumoniae subsp. quasipneumoniae]
MTTAINQKLQSSRKELLDIGLRNNMLNFRKTAKTLMVVDELAEEVFNILYRQDKTMTFSPISRKKLEELAEKEGGEDEEALLSELENLDYAGVFAEAEDEDESGTVTPPSGYPPADSALR